MNKTVPSNHRPWLLVCVLAITLGSSLPLAAHHSFAADYDVSQPLTLTGTVTKVEWMNPHVRFYMDVKDASDRVTNWVFELGSPNTLMHSGWTRNTLKTGQQITVQGCRAKDNSNQGNATSILSTDGKVLLSGRSAGQALVAR